MYLNAFHLYKLCFSITKIMILIKLIIVILEFARITKSLTYFGLVSKYLTYIRWVRVLMIGKKRGD